MWILNGIGIVVVVGMLILGGEILMWHHHDDEEGDCGDICTYLFLHNAESFLAGNAPFS